MRRRRLDTLLVDYENTEAVGPTVVQIITTLARYQRAAIHSSLEEKAYQLLKNHALQGYRIVYNAKLGLRKPEELLQYKEYEEKVFEALFDGSDECKVMLMSGENIDTVLKYCKPILASRPILVRIEIDLRSRLLHLGAHYSSAESMTEWLLSMLPAAAVQVTVPRSPALLQPIIETLVSDCSQRLLPPELISICDRVAVLKATLDTSLRSLSQSLRSRREDKGRQAEELRRSTEVLRTVKSAQLRLLSIAKQLTSKADIAVDVLQTECTSLENSLESLSRTLASINLTRRRRSPMLTVCAVSINSDGVLEAEIKSLKPYVVDGVVEVWEGECKVLEKRASFKGEEVVQLDEPLRQGSYRLHIKADSDEDLAQPYDFSIEKQEREEPPRPAEETVEPPDDLLWHKDQERFEQSLVYRSISNLEEIEAYLREQFSDYRVRLFHKAAGLWSNSSRERCVQLVQIFCRTDLLYDGDLWRELQAQGFQFQSKRTAATGSLGSS